MEETHRVHNHISNCHRIPHSPRTRLRPRTHTTRALAPNLHLQATQRLHIPHSTRHQNALGTQLLHTHGIDAAHNGANLAFGLRENGNGVLLDQIGVGGARADFTAVAVGRRVRVWFGADGFGEGGRGLGREEDGAGRGDDARGLGFHGGCGVVSQSFEKSGPGIPMSARNPAPGTLSFSRASET